MYVKISKDGFDFRGRERESKRLPRFVKFLFPFIFFITLFFTIHSTVHAASYYVSQAGADTNNGTSSSTPWKHHPWDSNATNTSLATVLQGDDVIYMRRGDIWYNTYLNANDVGSSGHQITTTSTNTFYKTSSSDPLPKLSGAYDPSTLVWTNTSGTIYSTPATTQPKIVLYNDTVLTLDNNTSPTLNKWYWVSNVLYVNVGEIPSSGTLEAGKQDCVYLNSQGYHTLSYLELRVANSTVGGVAFNNGYPNVIFDNLTVKGFAQNGLYQYNNSGDQVTNSSISEGTSTSNAGITASISSGVVITGNTITGAHGAGISVSNSPNAVVSGNTSDNNAGDGIDVTVSTGSSIQSNTVYGNGGHGVSVSGTSTNSSIQNNTIHDNTGRGITINGFTSPTISGNSIYNNNQFGITMVTITNPIVHDNTIYGNNGFGVSLNITTSGSIYNNSIHDNCSATSYHACAGIYITGSNSNSVYSNTIYNNTYGYYPTGGGYGIAIDGSSASNQIYKNNIYSNYVGITFTVSSGIDNNLVSYNLVKDSTVNDIDVSRTSTGYELIYNNTIIHNPSPNNNAPYTGHGLDIQESGLRAKFANNIIYVEQTGTNCEGLVLSGSYVDVWTDNNLLYDATIGHNGYIGAYSGPISSFSVWQADVQADSHVKGMDGIQGHAESHSVNADPLFIDAISNFALQANSPAINAGANVSLTSDYIGTTVPQGSAPDIGAYEFSIPNSPSSLAQYDSGGTAVIASGSFTGNSAVTFKFNMSSPSTSDSLTPQVEVRENGTGFSNSVTNSGSAVAYSGSPVMGTVTVSGLITVRTYHWQASVISSYGGQSAWVAMGGNPDFGVDTSAPNTSTSAPACSDSVTSGTPDLFEIHTTKNTATLYFAPPTMPYSNFYVAYSKNPSGWDYGTQYNQGYSGGVLSYAINSLQPNTKYYIKIRAGNGCGTGTYGNTMMATTTSSIQTKTYYKNTATAVVSSLLPSKRTIISSTSTPSPTITAASEINTPVPAQVPTQTQPVSKSKFCILWWCF